MNEYSVREISYQETLPWILDIHYAKRVPSISWAFGLYRDDELVGIITYGKPASAPLCKGIAGEENKCKVWELNRLALKDNIKNEASILISKSLKMLPQELIIVSYSDMAQDHLGFVYQATNWLYTGATKPRTDMYSSAGHSRHHDGDRSKRVFRSSKHRYVTFTGGKLQKKNLKKILRYKVYEEYPKKGEEFPWTKTLKS